MQALWIAIFALLGAAIGSFLNVCIDRLPAGKSIVYPPSGCDTCQHRLSIKDLVPVISYLWLRGRCRYCRAPIPYRILCVEVISATLMALTYWRYGFTFESAVVAFYCFLFVVLGVIDLEHGLILNKVTYPTAGIALLIDVLLPPSFLLIVISRGIVSGLLGGAIGFGLFFLLVVVSRGGMGWGDVKMAALIGLATGFPLVVIALLMGMILGGLVAGVLLLFKKRGWKDTIPSGAFYALGAMATLLWGTNILNWYLKPF